MTKIYNLTLRGILNTLSPVTVVPPNAVEVVDRDGGKYKRTFVRTVYRNGVRETLPAIPGSTLRGRLRRSVLEAVRLGLDTKFTLAEYHQNGIGGVKGAENENAFDYVFRTRLREANPILGLFGAGSPWMASRVSVSDALPTRTVETEIIGGTRADDGRRDDAFFDKLAPDAAEEWARLTGNNAQRTEAKATIKALRADIRKAKSEGNSTEVERLTSDLKQVEEDSKAVSATNPVSMPMQHEAMPSGVELEQQFVLRGVTAEEIGAFLVGMNFMWLAQPNLGQKASLGYGLVSGEYYVTLDEIDGGIDPFTFGNTQGEELGVVKVAPFVGIEFEGKSARLNDFVEAFKARLAAKAYDFRVASDLQERKRA